MGFPVSAVLPIFIVFAVIVVVMIFLSITRVPAGMVFVVESFSGSRKVWGEGVHFKIPLMDTVTGRVALGDQELEIPAKAFTAGDKRSVKVSVHVGYEIIDPIRYIYNAGGTVASLERLVTEGIETVIGSIPSDKVVRETSRSEAMLMKALEVSAPTLGFDNVSLRLGYPPDA